MLSHLNKISQERLWFCGNVYQLKFKPVFVWKQHFPWRQWKLLFVCVGLEHAWAFGGDANRSAAGKGALVYFPAVQGSPVVPLKWCHSQRFVTQCLTLPWVISKVCALSKRLTCCKLHGSTTDQSVLAYGIIRAHTQLDSDRWENSVQESLPRWLPHCNA